jgi:hypothetical protein
LGWAVIVIAVVGTVAFFVGVTWNEFAGTLCDYLSYVCGGGEDVVVVDFLSMPSRSATVVRR